MNLTDRFVRVLPLSDGMVLASDVRGRLHLLDPDLKLTTSSPALHDGLPTYAITVDDQYVVTKDRMGNITKWSLDTLLPLDRLEASQVRSPDVSYMEGEEPSPVINRGIAIWQDRVYVNNGYMQLVVIDLKTFAVIEIAESLSPVFLEWFCLDRPGQQAVSDKAGTLYLGDLEKLEFPIRVRVDDDSNVHRVLYDKRHDRFWATQDSGDSGTARVANGLVTVTPEGEVEQTLLFAADDVECLAFNADCSKAYAGGFDGDLVIFDNSEREVRIEKSVHAFTHEIIDLAVLMDGSIAVLTQDGRLVKTSPEGELIGSAEYVSQCVWDIQAVPGSAGSYRVATDTGVQTVEARVDGVGSSLTRLANWPVRSGFVRRVLCTTDFTFGITHGGEIFCFDINGDPVWTVTNASRLHAIALDISGNRLLVAADAGAFEYDASSGMELGVIGLDGHHIWAVGYLDGGERVIASHNFEIGVFGADSDEPSWRLADEGYPKRLTTSGDKIFITGGGGVREISVSERRVVRRWDTMLDNTVENFVFHGPHLYAVSYGCQLGLFDAQTTDEIGMIEPLPDFPKGLAVHPSTNGEDVLLVGGRGGYVQLRRIDDGGEPVLTRTCWLPQ